MADEIRQDLGFDAAQALETINNLNTGFDKLFQTLNTSPRAFDSFNQHGQQTIDTLKNIASQVKTTTAALSSVASAPVPGVGGGSPTTANAQAAAAAQLTQNVGAATAATNALGQAAKQTGSATTNALQSSTRAAGGFALSLETITRVLGTQLIVRTLGLIQREIEQSFGDFIKLEQALGQLAAVSGDSIENLQKELVGLSDAFNVPLLDVVKAKYEILQNGFRDTADSVTVLTASLKFARIAGIDAGVSAGLISGALNSSGESAESAELQVAKFTKAIEQAKLSGGELATSVARFAPLGNELGVANDELIAAFTTLVDMGVKPTEAATQVRQSVVALLKPSADLVKVYKQLGIENGQQIIQAFGYKGAIDAVINTTDRSAGSIEKLFPTMRALTGILIEAGSGAERFTQHLEDNRAVGAQFANEKLKATIDTNVEQVTADFNTFKNFLTTEVGRSLVLTTKSVIDMVGGINTLIDVFRTVVPTLGVVTAALVSYSLFCAAATAKNRLAAVSFTEATTAASLFGGVLTGLTVLFAGFEAGKAIGQLVNDSFNQERATLAAEGAKILQLQREQDQDRLNQQKQANRDRFQLFDQAISQERAAYNKQVDTAKEANDQLVSDDKASLGHIIEAHEKFVGDLKRAADEAEHEVVKSKEISNNEIAKLSDQRFDHETQKQSELGQFQADQSRGQQLAAIGLRALLTSTTEKEADAARKTLDRADGYKKQAIEAAKVLGFVSSADEIERQQEQIIQQRINAELKFQKVREAEAAQARTAATQEQDRVDKLKALSKTFLENSKLFDKQGNPLQGDQLTKHAQAAKTALADIQKLAFDKSGKFNLSDLFSFDALQRDIDKSISGVDVEHLNATPNALDGVVQQIQGALDNADIILKVAVDLGIDTSQIGGKSKLDALNFLQSQAKEVETTNNKLNEQTATRANLERQIANDQARGLASFTAAETIGEHIAKGESRFVEIFTPTAAANSQTNANVAIQQQRIDGLRASVLTAMNDPKITAEVINNLADKFKDFQDHASITFKVDVSKAAAEFDILKDVFEQRLKIQQLDKAGGTDAAAEKAQQQSQAAEDRLKFEQQNQDALKQNQAATTDAATSSITWASQTLAIATASQTIADNFALAVASLNELNTGSAGFGSPTIQSSAQIATSAPIQATLDASQAAQVPGSINVTVNQDIATNDPQQLARDLIPAINREMRRRASELRA